MSCFGWLSISEAINSFQPRTSENDHILTARSLTFLQSECLCWPIHNFTACSTNGQSIELCLNLVGFFITDIIENIWPQTSENDNIINA